MKFAAMATSACIKIVYDEGEYPFIISILDKR